MASVIFDLEGTLVDFEWDVAGGVTEATEALVALGFPEGALPNNYATLLNTAVREADRYGIDPEQARRRVDRVYDRFDADALDRWQLRDGARDALAAAPSRALVTNVGREATTTLCEREELTFDIVVTRDDVELIKPDPSGLARAAAHLAGTPLFVGDSAVDVRAGHEAGLDVVLVRGGEDERADLSEPPEYDLSSLHELPERLAG